MNLPELDHHTGPRVVSQTDGAIGAGAVIYLMNRDQRVDDNPALIAAQEIAFGLKRPLEVWYLEPDNISDWSLRQFSFMIEGLREVERELSKLNINFVYKSEPDARKVSGLFQEHDPACLLLDFSPLRYDQSRCRQIKKQLAAPLIEIDAHNIVPVTKASNKAEFAAYTIRPKIERQLGEFLTAMPRMKKHPFPPCRKTDKVDWNRIQNGFRGDRLASQINTIKPGTTAGMAQLRHFLEGGFGHYASRRNDPTISAQSGLSPYLHFGQVSAQRVALEIDRCVKGDFADREAFLDELIIRRELSDNFCYYSPAYDRFEGFPEWAQKSLTAHINDRREYLYTSEQFRDANTHDSLWNAAQREMILTGKTHGFMRMYWAKKILEWTPAPQVALEIAIDLNDRFSIDGRDPNGYVGVAWSIGGVHDRAWFEREIFGKVRYMNENGCRRKFDVPQYISRINSLAGEVAA